MSRNKHIQIKFIYTIFVITIPLLLVLSGINRLNGIFFPPDEFGYWASAATILGKDWGNVISGQSFYAFGYGLLLTPIMKLIDSPLIMYQVAIMLNAVLVGINGLLLPKLIKTLMPDLDDKENFFSCFPAAMYVGTLSYMHYSLAESLLQLCFTLLCFFIANFFITNAKKYFILSLILSSFLLITHYRTVPIFLSTLFFLIYKLIYKSKASASNGSDASGSNKIIYFVIALVTIVLIALFVIINKNSMQSTYLTDQFNRVLSCFEIKNAGGLIIGLLGKFCYITVASMGLAVYAIIYLINNRELKLFSLFFIISLLICILESTIFFVGASHFDYVFYGRYTEQYVPILIAVGFASYNRTKKQEEIFYGALIGVGGCFLIYILYASFAGTAIEYRGDFIPAISWAIYTGSKSLSFIILKIMLVFLIAQLILSKRFIKAAPLKCVEIAIGFVFIGLAVLNVSHAVYPYHELDKSDLALFDTIKQEEEDGKAVVFLDYPGTNYVGLMQFYLQDCPITVVDGSSESEMEYLYNQENIKFIIAAYYDFEVYGTVNDSYDNCCESAHFRLYY